MFKCMNMLLYILVWLIYCLIIVHLWIVFMFEALLVSANKHRQHSGIAGICEWYFLLMGNDYWNVRCSIRCSISSVWLSVSLTEHFFLYLFTALIRYRLLHWTFFCLACLDSGLSVDNFTLEVGNCLASLSPAVNFNFFLISLFTCFLLCLQSL